MTAMKELLTPDTVDVLTSGVDADLHLVPKSFNQRKDVAYGENLRFDFRVEDENGNACVKELISQDDPRKDLRGQEALIPLRGGGVIVIYATKWTYVDDEKVTVPTLTKDIMEELLEKVQIVSAKRGPLSYNMLMAVLDKVEIRHSVQNFIPGRVRDHKRTVLDKDGNAHEVVRLYQHLNPVVENHAFRSLLSELDIS